MQRFQRKEDEIALVLGLNIRSLHAEQPDKKEEASQRALENFCHAVMNLAAFIYID